LLVDQPQIPADLLRALVDTHASSLAPIVAPMVDGRRGNPVLFDRVTFPDFAGIEGDVGGRAVFSKHPVAWLPWLDASAALDVDTPADYQRLLNYED
jgi:molybdenum cofactor cytidylyltransferase